MVVVNDFVCVNGPHVLNWVTHWSQHSCAAANETEHVPGWRCFAVALLPPRHPTLPTAPRMPLRVLHDEILAWLQVVPQHDLLPS